MAEIPPPDPPSVAKSRIHPPESPLWRNFAWATLDASDVTDQLKRQTSERAVRHQDPGRITTICEDSS